MLLAGFSPAAMVTPPRSRRACRTTSSPRAETPPAGASWTKAASSGGACRWAAAIRSGNPIDWRPGGFLRSCAQLRQRGVRAETAAMVGQRRQVGVIGLDDPADDDGM